MRDADDSRARRWRPRRAVFVSVAAVVVVLVVAGAIYAVARGDDQASRGATPSTTSQAAAPSSVATTPTGATTRDNVRATRARSRWMLHAVPMPRGSREWSRSPEPAFRQRTFGVGPADQRFTRSTWWTVPVSEPEFETWLSTHVPTGLTFRPDDGGAYSVDDGRMAQQDDLNAAGSSAYTPGFLVFSSLPYGDGLAVRVDTFIGARFARTTFVPKDTSAVRITRIKGSTTGTRPRVPTRRTTLEVTDRAGIADLVAAVNRLPGSMTVPFVASCPAILVQTRYAVSFTTPRGTHRLSFDGGPCWPQARLFENGTRTRPTLEPGDLASTLDRYLEGS